MTGVHVLGSRAAAALIDVGLSRADVIRGLIGELALTHAEAEAAWRRADDRRVQRLG
jgi:hypothetical protein